MRGFPFPLAGETNSTRCMAMINKQSKMARLLTNTAIAAGLGLGLAVVPTEKSEASACGFYKVGVYAYYGHCPSSVNLKTVVRVRVDHTFSHYEFCARPGSYYLGEVGGIDGVKNAYYTGMLCR
jgi:hypothetical protein